MITNDKYTIKNYNDNENNEKQMLKSGSPNEENMILKLPPMMAQFGPKVIDALRGNIGRIVGFTAKNPTAGAALAGFTLTAIGDSSGQALVLGTNNTDVKASLEQAC